MLDLLLQINMTLTIWVNDLLSMGLPLIDKSLEEVIDVFKNSPTSDLNGQITSWARTIGACLALGVGSYEAWMMILGRRGMDVMKILRIVVISVCLSGPGMKFIHGICDAPGDVLSTAAQNKARRANAELDLQEKAVAKEQKVYLDSLRALQAKQMEQKEAQDALEESEEAKGGMMDKIKSVLTGIGNSIENLGTEIENQAKQAALLVETKAVEIINGIIRFIGEVLFQMTYYSMLVGQRIFLNILWLFMPVAFAMSLAPPFRSAWSQWLSKYLSLTLWPFIIYLISYYVDYLLMYFIKKDLTAYEHLIGGVDMNNWGTIGTLGIQGIGTTCMYVVGLLAGAKILSMVPEVASWLIPGGVSSSMGQMSAGVAAAAGGYAGSAAGTAAGIGAAVAGGVAGSAARAGAAAVGGMASGASTGGNVGGSMGGSGATGMVGRAVGTMVGAVGGGVTAAAGSVGHDFGHAVGGGGRSEAFHRGQGKDDSNSSGGRSSSSTPKAGSKEGSIRTSSIVNGMEANWKMHPEDKFNPDKNKS